jgi:hypothetical protein
MAPSQPFSRADRDRVLIQIARRTALAEYDRRIIENTQQIIQRSRELLERTKHQVLPPSQRV